MGRSNTRNVLHIFVLGLALFALAVFPLTSARASHAALRRFFTCFHCHQSKDGSQSSMMFGKRFRSVTTIHDFTASTGKQNALRFARQPRAQVVHNELYEVLRQMIASLKDAHTRVYSPEEKFDWWNPRFVTVGLTVREVEGVPTVFQVEQDRLLHKLTFDRATRLSVSMIFRLPSSLRSA